jgi:superfamily II DNA or RNA helicase
MILSKEGYLIKKKNNIELIDKIKEELTVTPYMPFNKNIKPEPFPVYLENEKYICVPKYYGIEKFGLPDKNKELPGETIDIHFKGELRPKQKEVMDIIIPKLQKDDGGLLSVGCGFGKTLCALYIATVFKVKTLVIVHKSFLLNQWVERAKEFTDAKIGIIQQNKINIEGNQIVIGMLQSIAKDKYDVNVFKDFGFVIFDEAHHAPSKYFSRALPIIACKKSLALSATPKRTDKLEKVLHWYFGPIIYKAPTETLNTVQVNAYKYNCTDKNFKEFKQNYGADINTAKTLTKLTEINERNKFILILIKELLEEEGRKLLILSDRLEHLKVIKESIDQLELCTTSYYVGGMKEKQLTESAKATIIFSSYSMSSEGLDIPELNTLMMLTPRKEVEQIVGRITRKTDHPVQPIIIDMIDQLPTYNRQFNNRKKFYCKKDFSITLFEVEGHTITNEYNYENLKKSEIIIDTNELDNDGFLD